MADLQEYIKKRSDKELRGIINSYCLGTISLSADIVLEICNTLAQRDPHLPNPCALFFSLCRMYS